MKFNDLKKISLKQVAYPAVFVLLIAVIIFAVSKTLVYAEAVMDGIFYNENFRSENLTHLNLADYKLLADKLAIPVQEISLPNLVGAIAEEATSTIQVPTTTVTTTLANIEISTTTSSSAPVLVVPDKNIQKIMVLNATLKKGIAKTLADSLRAGGFGNIEVGNYRLNLKNTVMERSTSTPAVIYEEIRAIVLKAYPNFIENTTSSDAVTIYIGE